MIHDMKRRMVLALLFAMAACVVEEQDAPMEDEVAKADDPFGARYWQVLHDCPKAGQSQLINLDGKTYTAHQTCGEGTDVSDDRTRPDHRYPDKTITYGPYTLSCNGTGGPALARDNKPYLNGAYVEGQTCQRASDALLLPR